MDKVLDIENLRVAFAAPNGIIKAVEGINLTVERGQCVALVGESGCGKSVTSLASMKLISSGNAIVKTDRHMLCGEDITDFTEAQMSEIRGKKASMIFQDALSALNPVMTVGKQIDEIFFRHLGLKKKEAKERSIEALRSVGIPDPAARYRSYPHELSGGMRQRVLIAMAFACNPELIIADEPTTAMDVTIQAQIMELLKELQVKHGTGLLLVSHDLSVVAHMADKIMVMYSGKIVEEASARELITNPVHPYTKGLLSSVIKINDTKGRFTQIKGTLPDPANKPAGCYFCPRCSFAEDICREKKPFLKELKEGHSVRCHFVGGGENE